MKNVGGLDQGQRRLIGHQGHISMELQDRSRHLRGDRTEEGLLYGLRLILTADHQKDLPGLHDGPDPHGVGLTGHFVGGSEEAAVRLDRGLG